MAAAPRSPRTGARRWWAAGGLGVSIVAIADTLAVPALADSGPARSPEANPVAHAAHAEAAVPGTPCSVSTRACVDLESQRAWLIRDGQVVRGPMRIASGGEGKATPVGHSYRVYRKEEHHVSGESTTREGRPAPMPYSTDV